MVVGLLAAGQVGLTVFLVCLIAASRIYDPIKSGVFMNMAAVYSAQIRIERMRAIVKNSRYRRARTSISTQGNNTFDHVKFAYNENEGRCWKTFLPAARQGW